MIEIIQDDLGKPSGFGFLLRLPNDALVGRDGLSAWADLAPFELAGEPPEIGLALVGRRGLLVHRLERHSRTSELLIPADGDIIVAVSPPTAQLAGCQAAIRVRLGQALMLNPGVWHSVAFPFAETATYWWLHRRGTGATDVAFADLPEPEGLILDPATADPSGRAL